MLNFASTTVHPVLASPCCKLAIQGDACSLPRLKLWSARLADSFHPNETSQSFDVYASLFYLVFEAVQLVGRGFYACPFPSEPPCAPFAAASIREDMGQKSIASHEASELLGHLAKNEKSK
jgi:hypothetical protein